MHCHVLGSILLPAIIAPWILDVRSRTGPERRQLLVAGAVGAMLLLLSYVPLLIHELNTNFSEARAALAFIAGGGESASLALPVRVLVIGLRVLAWPLVGLITNAPVAALSAATVVIVALVWRAIAGNALERRAARWFGLTLIWTTFALAVAASGLATVVPRLPNDHYHAFADPIVFVAIGLAVAALVGAGDQDGGRGMSVQRIAIVGGVAIVAVAVAFNLVRQPPAVSPDGGWPAGDAAGIRVLDDIGGPAAYDYLILHSLPEVKSADAIRFPIVRRGAVAPETWPDSMGHELLPHVVLCDALFEEAIGAACNGPAEDAAVAAYGPRLIDRFEAAPGRWVSVYLPE